MSAGLEPTTFGVFQREPKTNALPLRQDTFIWMMIKVPNNNIYIIYDFTSMLFIAPSLSRSSLSRHLNMVFDWSKIIDTSKLLSADLITVVEPARSATQIQYL
jgi:hypothetical protein